MDLSTLVKMSNTYGSNPAYVLAGGGNTSVKMCIRDRDNSGIILNAVHSRDNCFLYLKEIVKGESYVMLSQEEVEALRKAVNFELGEMSEDEKNLEK